MKIGLVFFVYDLMFFVSVSVLQAQTVTNVTAEQVGKTIHVSYDLNKQADITLFVSTDGGSTYTKLYRVSGDVGKNVSAGHKTIAWDVLAERERLVGENIVFKVRALSEDDLTFTVNGVSFKMIYVKGGTFTMGCTSEQGSDCESNEKPSHSVILSDFWMGETEVTQALWQAVMGSTPTFEGGWESLYGKGNDYPAYKINWEVCKEFCNKLNSRLSDQLPSGCRFALPTEAQWEYAARGGNKSRNYKYCGSNNIEEVAWYWGNSGKTHLNGEWNYTRVYNNKCQTHPVRQKKANELGLYDMSGNVEEWCLDGYGNYSSSSQTNPLDSSSDSFCTLRGGCWSDRAIDCRVSNRGGYWSDRCSHNIGLRLSLVR